MPNADVGLQSEIQDVDIMLLLRTCLITATMISGGLPLAAFAQQISPVPGSLHQHENHQSAGKHSHDGMKMTPDSAIASPQRVGSQFVKPPPVPGESTFSWKSLSGGESQEQSYSLAALLSLAAQNNPTLLQARLHINAELARAMQAGLYPNPTASYIAEQIGLDGTAGEWQGAEIEQRFVTAGKLDLSRSKYLHRAKVAEHLAVAQQFRVCNDVRVHFFMALAAREVAELQRELLKTAEDHLVTTREMYNLGQANRADAHKANALLQMHRLKLMKAENDVRRHTIEVMTMVGIDAHHVLLEGSLFSDRDLIDFDSAYAQIIECSPELLAAYAKLREDSTTIQREKVEWIPDVVVGGGAGYNNIDRQTTASAMVSIEIPLFDRNQGTVQQAQVDYRRQQNEIRRLRLALRKHLATEYDKYLTAWQHVTQYDSVILPAKKSAYELALQSYKASRLGWPEVLAAQEAYTTARIELVGHQQMQRTSEVMMDGYLLHGGLQTPDGPMPAGHIDSVPKPR
jgi:cobalt-zinc-cadmium efflux system outer membrane protein